MSAVGAAATTTTVEASSVAASIAAAEALAGLGVHGVATALSNLSGCAATVSVAVVRRSIVGRTNGAIAEASIVGAVYRALIASEV